MTAFTTTQLPTGARACDTVERLVLWGAQIIQRFNAKATYNRLTGEAQEPMVRVNEFFDADGVPRTQIVVTLERDLDAVGANTPDWRDVKELSVTAIPAMFGG